MKLWECVGIETPKKIHGLIVLTKFLILISYASAYFLHNLINNKILDCDWSSARLFLTSLARGHVGVQ